MCGGAFLSQHSKPHSQVIFKLILLNADGGFRNVAIASLTSLVVQLHANDVLLLRPMDVGIDVLVLTVGLVGVLDVVVVAIVIAFVAGVVVVVFNGTSTTKGAISIILGKHDYYNRNILQFQK
jgi:hypothetical protein